MEGKLCSVLDKSAREPRNGRAFRKREHRHKAQSQRTSTEEGKEFRAATKKLGGGEPREK